MKENEGRTDRILGALSTFGGLEEVYKSGKVVQMDQYRGASGQLTRESNKNV